MTDLPPLPPPGFRHHDDAYTAAEMREYGAACATTAQQEEQKRCKDLIRRYMPVGWSALYDSISISSVSANPQNSSLDPY